MLAVDSACIPRCPPCRRVAMDLATTVERIQQNFCICDPNLPDNPIVFASDGFLEMSRYDRFEVLGRNCRFMQARHMTPMPCFVSARTPPWPLRGPRPQSLVHAGAPTLVFVMASIT